MDKISRIDSQNNRLVQEQKKKAKTESKNKDAERLESKEQESLVKSEKQAVEKQVVEKQVFDKQGAAKLNQANSEPVKVEFSKNAIVAEKKIAIKSKAEAEVSKNESKMLDLNATKFVKSTSERSKDSSLNSIKRVEAPKILVEPNKVDVQAKSVENSSQVEQGQVSVSDADRAEVSDAGKAEAGQAAVSYDKQQKIPSKSDSARDPVQTDSERGSKDQKLDKKDSNVFLAEQGDTGDSANKFQIKEDSKQSGGAVFTKQAKEQPIRDDKQVFEREQKSNSDPEYAIKNEASSDDLSVDSIESSEGQASPKQAVQTNSYESVAKQIDVGRSLNSIPSNKKLELDQKEAKTNSNLIVKEEVKEQQSFKQEASAEVGTKQGAKLSNGTEGQSTGNAISEIMQAATGAIKSGEQVQSIVIQEKSSQPTRDASVVAAEKALEAKADRITSPDEAEQVARNLRDQILSNPQGAVQAAIGGKDVARIVSVLQGLA